MHPLRKNYPILDRLSGCGEDLDLRCGCGHHLHFVLLDIDLRCGAPRVHRPPVAPRVPRPPVRGVVDEALDESSAWVALLLGGVVLRRRINVGRINGGRRRGGATLEPAGLSTRDGVGGGGAARAG